MIHAARAVWNWTLANAQNAYGTFKVVDFSYLRPMPSGLLEDAHPWITGLSPRTGRPIWPDNLVYASHRSKSFEPPEPEEDSTIVARIGRFLSKMVAKSSPTPEIPHGPHRRMPHAVNYLHGSVHYNGGYLVFDDIRDAMSHLDDRTFLSELKRFSRLERRVVTLVLRDRLYDLEELAWFVAFVRARLPWYANGNGPSPRRVLFGVPSPYPSVNLINRSWIRDLHALLAGDEGLVLRPPVEPGRYFLGSYGSSAPVSFSFLERTHAWVVHGIIRARGSQEGLVFSSRQRIEPERFRQYRETKGRTRTSHPVSNPFFRRRSP